MGVRHKRSDAPWRATYSGGGPLDGHDELREHQPSDVPNRPPLGYSRVEPIVSDDPCFVGYHTYHVSHVDTTNRTVEFSYSGEMWGPAD